MERTCQFRSGSRLEDFLPKSNMDLYGFNTVMRIMLCQKFPSLMNLEMDTYIVTFLKFGQYTIQELWKTSWMWPIYHSFIIQQ
jgi:hypothetical protein